MRTRTRAGAPPNPSYAEAYLNWAFFDENMNFIPPDGLGGGSGYDPIKAEDDVGDYVSMIGVRAPKNGYVLVYVSNKSDDQYVYFDNLQVTHERGRILEENTYYPDGLKISGLCAKAFNKLPNEFGYQGNYAEEEEESGYDEFALRHYDPTIGRWLSTDPYDEFASPYVGMGNDPVNNVDPDGGGVGDPVGDALWALGKWLFGGGSKGPIGQWDVLKGSSGNGFKGFNFTRFTLNLGASLVGTSIGKKVFPLPKPNLRSLPLSNSRVSSKGTITRAFPTVAVRFTGTVLAVLYPSDAIKGRPDGPDPLGYRWGGDQYIPIRNAHEKITDDPSTLSDDYIQGVKQRMMAGQGSAQDWLYRDEVLRREIEHGLTELGDWLKNPANEMGLADDFLESATKPTGNQGLTVVGRALQKHSGRSGSPFQDTKFSHITGNQDALDILNQIINSKNKIIQPADNGGRWIFDKTTGKGFGVSRQGLFNGFRDLPK